jgi:hypothetical protein
MNKFLLALECKTIELEVPCKKAINTYPRRRLFVMACDCAFGSAFCLHCYCTSLHYIKRSTITKITCPCCSKAGPIRPDILPYGVLRFCKTLQQIPLYMHSKPLFVRISSDWGVFSRYYRDDFLNLTSHNLQKIKMMYALHQIFFLSQMNPAVGSPTRIQLICNPWRENPQPQFILKMLRINLARKLVCKLFATESFNLFTRKIFDFPTQEIKMTESFNLFKQSYLQRSHNRFLPQKMMYRLLMYLMAHL